ncbi:tripartite tricarboxylate transporter TctB family protein [Pararhizobium mangrovi]|uniref:Tripartite tricarboxylate transporter TctB family protein n=1 Tax=Pararhizobium mangrovi TaxID=2590452 RepID=A0A506UBJ0_9HYPH|nr:tripartite tricarboxylate transporter TctB family protein [Pararhizobium mangrovi]TPW30374.1 tripartite tricarboxylate transporter TctB family protein [Pararhizobium mangrovi]
MKTNDLLFSAFYIVVLLIAGTQLSKLSDTNSAMVSSKLFPTLVIGAGLAVGVIETLRTLIAKTPDGAPSFSMVWSKAFAARRMMLLGVFVVYLFTITLVGFLVATSVFCFVAIILLTPKPRPSTFLGAAIVTAGTIGVIYELLVVYLQAFLP